MADRNKNEGLEDYLELLNWESEKKLEKPVAPKKATVKSQDGTSHIKSEQKPTVKEANTREKQEAKAAQKPSESLRVPVEKRKPPLRNIATVSTVDDEKEQKKAPKAVKTPPIKEKNDEKKTVIKERTAQIPANEKKNSNGKKSKPLTKKKKIAIAVISAFLAVVLIFGIAVNVFISGKFKMLGDKIDKNNNSLNLSDKQLADINIDIGSQGFKQALTDWAMSGNENKMTSKNVMNVLLVGVDEGGSNTDSMILVSVNKKEKTLKLVSFFRDSYLYVDAGDYSRCTKINAAYSMGGIECLLETIENNYKIEIDGYAMVDFTSFKSLIDAMGGVTVDVQEYEANYIISESSVYIPSGNGVTLNGNQALKFCRVRHSDADGDVSRTRRQRQVINAIIDRVKTASVGDLSKYADVVLPYVDTSYTKSEIISLGVKALTGGWVGFERSQLQMPTEDTRIPGNEDMWIWVVDYQLAAQQLQTELYGKSNIVLQNDRTSLIDIYNGTEAAWSGTSYTTSIDSGSSEETSSAENTTELSQSVDVPEVTEQAPSVEIPTQAQPLEEVTAQGVEADENSATPEQDTGAQADAENGE